MFTPKYIEEGRALAKILPDLKISNESGSISRA
jgi:hypothetical protein